MKVKETENLLKKSIKNLQAIIEECVSFFKNSGDFAEEVNKKYNINKELIDQIKIKAKDASESIKNLTEEYGETFFLNIKKMLLDDYGVFVDLLKMLFFQIVCYSKKQNIIDFISSSDDPSFSFIGGNYLLLTVNHKTIKNIVNQFFFHVIKLKNEILIDDNTELWQVSDMEHKIFPSDYYKIRIYANIITEDIADALSANDLTLLKQQVSELIKNAIKHGNHNDENKVIKVWYKFSGDRYKLIVEDQGEGFKDIEKWNEFNHKRNEAILNQDMEKIAQLVSFHTEKSDDKDNGNALFAALEYWDSGLIYNKNRNKVLAVKYFYSLQK